MHNVGIIGLGQIAYSIDNDKNRKIIWSHIKAYQALPNIHIQAVCSRDINKVKQIQSDCNIKKGYTDFNQMLDENQFDIVSICTPIQTHYEIVKKCIATGVKAIFCEKTLCYSVEQAEEMIQLCQQQNIILAVNHILRWDSFTQQIKTYLNQNLIGKIYSITAYGATALHTSTSHLIDLMVYFADSEPHWVVGELQKDYIREAHGLKDQGGIGMVKFKSGVMGFIKGCSASPQHYMLEIDILGEKGRITLLNNGNSLRLYQYMEKTNSAGKSYLSLELVNEIEKNEANQNERMIDAIKNIINGIETKQKIISSGETSLSTIKIIEAMKQSEIQQNIIFIH